MASVGVPAAFRQALQALHGLEEEDARRVIDALRSADPFSSINDLRDRVQEALPEDRKSDAERLVPALLSLRGQLRTSPPERLAEAVSNSPNLELDEAGRKQLKERLAEILSSEALATTANALELLTQHDRNYQTARVFTDIRPVFSEDAVDPPRGAVLVQMLQIQTWDREGEGETIYIAMDEPDLVELREVVDRALAKTKTLRALLEEQEIARFELDKRDI